MTDHIEETAHVDEDSNEVFEGDPDDDAAGDELDRAPQPGTTPAPGEPTLDSGAITGGRLAEDH